MTRFGRLPDAFVADVLGRVSVALAAGIGPKRAWESEAARAPARFRPALAAVAGALASGADLATALAAAGNAFGPVVRGMAVVADRTGHDAEVLRAVAATLRDALAARRELRGGLVKPALQLMAAVAAVGVLIVVSGGSSGLDGRPLDLVGLGLRGMSGLRTYLIAVAAALAAAVVGVILASRNWAAGGVVRRLALAVPVLGPALAAADTAAWCRAAALAGSAGIDPGGVVRIAAAAAPGLRIDGDEIERRLRGGADFAEALSATGRLGRRVIEAVATGEMTGTTPEALDRLAGRLDEEARAGLVAAARGAGFAAWAAVAAVITLVVFRFFSLYAGLINEAARPL